MPEDLTPIEDTASAKPDRRTTRRARAAFFALNVLVLALSTFTVLCFAEIALRLFRPQPLAGVMFVQDPKFGFWNRPSLRKKMFQSEPNTPFYAVTTTSGGYRGLLPVPPVKEPQARRILILGDSFTFGVGVGDDETYPAILKSALSRYEIPDLEKGARRFEIVNAGCPGWGTENELAFWRARANELAPDLVVIAYFRNDLADNMRHMLYRLKDGQLVYKPASTLSRAKRLTAWIPFYGFLSEHSHVMNLARRIAARAMTRGPQGAVARQAEAKTPSPAVGKASSAPTEFDDQLKTYSLLMQSLLADAGARKKPVVLLLVAGRNEVEGPPPADFLAVERLAERWHSEGKIAAIVNPREALVAARSKGAKLFIPHDGHYTPEGNRIVGEQLAQGVWGLLK